MVCARIIGVALLGLASLSACSGPAAPAVDAGDGDAALDDGGGQGSSLRFQFVSMPTVPADLGGDYAETVASVDLDLRNVRAIGDAAPGDERTTAAEYAIAFGFESPPNFLLFDQAPPGMYSHLLAQIVGYQISGTVVLSADPIPYLIDDTPPTPLSVSIPLTDVRVVDDQRTDVVVEIDVGQVLGEISWELFDPGSESVDIDQDWSAISELREHLVEGFQGEEDDGGD